MVAEINQVARSRLVADRGGLNLRDQVISRPSLMGGMARPVAPIANAVMAARPVRLLVEKTIGVHRGAAMPKFSAMTFRSWARSHRAPADAIRSVAYFHGCAVQDGSGDRFRGRLVAASQQVQRPHSRQSLDLGRVFT